MGEAPAPFVTATTAIARGAPPALRHVSSRAEAEEVARNYEAFFLSQVLESMFAGIETDGLFGGGHAEAVFRSLMLQEYGKVIAKQGGIGLADAFARDMLKLQEVK